jgi:4'-phosphopantetheinyl transferase EntD
VTVAVWGVDVLATDSYAVEELAVRGAIPKRQEEFRRGRACARAAMDSLGAAAEAIPVGPNREPVWPPGLVGSITHCGSVVAAAVARADSLGGLGLDMERAEPLEPGVEGLVMLPAERAAAGAPWRGALVFSAKESVYKALFPLTRRWLGFEEVQLTLTSEGFQPTLIAPDPDGGMDPERGTDPELVSALRGSWAVEGGYVITLASLPVASVPRRP